MTADVILIKVARAAFTLWIVVTFAFFVLHASGDPIDALLGDQASQEVIEYYTKKFGLDRPLGEQYLSYLNGVLHGDFGISLSDRTPALQLVLQAIPNTLLLAGTSFTVGLLFGIPMGIVAALNRNKSADRFVMGFSVFGFSVPNFFFGILLILLFSLHLRWLPSSGSGSAAHIVLPAITLGSHFAGMFARFTRSAMLEVLEKSYIEAARAKGVPYRRRIVWHALPNAAIPVVTIAGLKLGDLLAGSIVVETVFAWPGMGRLLVGSVSSRDLAVVQACLILAAGAMVFINLTVDLLYGLLDPRARTGATRQA